MFNYRLTNVLTGDETTGSTATRRIAFEEIATHIMLVLSARHRVVLTRSAKGLDVYLVVQYPKGREGKQKTPAKYKKLYEAEIYDATA